MILYNVIEDKKRIVQYIHINKDKVTNESSKKLDIIISSDEEMN